MSGQSLAELGKVVNDSDLVYREVTDEQIKKFVKTFRNNHLTDNQISFLNDVCRSNNISVIWQLARMQTEQGVIINLDDRDYGLRLARCCGFALWSKRPPLGFEEQNRQSVECVRAWASTWKKGTKVYVVNKGNVTCMNSATYALHKYNPIWGMASNYGVFNMGSSLFVKVLRQFQSGFLTANK